ncbi:translesion error-prone DNA polymerase V autoproteolytic subunit [Microbacterium paludicola]|uniref:Translesion error-prone DNA polymerase V autoproteolytic subunit n=1 Tax=Microbacterium paludicola TaxID=300019 RepID=A0A4Y9FUX4_9MICO|nr:translesion error-prone DNA polymerase V autoproteolytic subunit [Microbacterium paludicola]MBF0816228.1 translesion error-prone DNA polymerase V autoproteolytic subunit [Microbacterium paludicola]TFU33034.1 translesion error-prone DNA polymerase V autoproteolytic subunit [Microbacterium paludicola]
MSRVVVVGRAALLAPLRPLPLAPVAVPAGFPSPAEGWITDELDLNEHLVKDRTATMFVRVSGDSMEPAGISHGDVLIVDRSLRPVHDDIVIAVLDGELTVKRLWISPRGVTLHADNPRYPDLHVGELSALSIYGVVRTSLHVFTSR